VTFTTGLPSATRLHSYAQRVVSSVPVNQSIQGPCLELLPWPTLHRAHKTLSVYNLRTEKVLTSSDKTGREKEMKAKHATSGEGGGEAKWREIFKKSVPGEPSCSMRTNGQIKWHDEANSHFSRFCEHTWKRKVQFRTSQETQCVSVTNAKPLTLYGAIMANYCQDHTGHMWIKRKCLMLT